MKFDHMDISNNSVKNLVQDPEFIKWVLQPNQESNLVWEKYISENPDLKKDVELARDMVLEIFSHQNPLQKSEYREMWDYIDAFTDMEESPSKDEKIIPIYSRMHKKSAGTNTAQKSKPGILWKIAAVFLGVLGLGITVNTFVSKSPPAPVAIESSNFEEYITPPGVKSSITLGDGSKVLLNSGSKLKYIKNFSMDKREVLLEGEAFFEVYKDPGRPFIVQTGGVSTTALGTSFNINAYGENLMISLVTGKVAIEIPDEKQEAIILEEKQKLNVQLENGNISKGGFDEDEAIGWTRKMIVFNKTELSEAIRTLENWYGVTFYFQNQPNSGLYLSGRFYNETLENVLEGLKHTARMDYKIKGDTVNITFKN